VINQVTREQFRTLEEASYRFRTDRSQLRTSLLPDYADTFWFYYLFGEIPGRRPGLAERTGRGPNPNELP
jgi:hypothetical protein